MWRSPFEGLSLSARYSAAPKEKEKCDSDEEKDKQRRNMRGEKSTTVNVRWSQVEFYYPTE